MSEMNSQLLSRALDEALQHGQGGVVDDILQAALIGPVREFLGRPSKQIRGQLVDLGFALVGKARDAEQSAVGAEILEAIHAGSLVVDDIQDGSRFRRGQPTMHRQHGIPLALNAGNWLYFWPLERLPRLGLPAAQELLLYRLCHQALLRAHFGQAVDLGTPIDALPQARIASVVRASLELKTGALTALAVCLGGALAGADEARLEPLRKFGTRFGVALQMFDDLGNLKVHGTDEKQYEDLRLRRPSWVWAVAAENFDAAAFDGFLQAVRSLPDDSGLRKWLGEKRLPAVGRDLAREYLAAAVRELATEVDRGRESALAETQILAERLSRSYE